VAKKKKHKKVKKISNRQAKTFPKKQKIEMARPKFQADFIKGFGEVKSPAHAKAFELPGEIKMSAVILKLADPLLKKFWGKEKQVRSLISITVNVWNLSMMPEDRQEDLRNEMIEGLVPKGGDAEDVASIVYLIDLILERKKKFFPDIQNVIIEHKLTIDGDNIKLDVGSAPVKPL
jgi:hypothetical protein